MRYGLVSLAVAVLAGCTTTNILVESDDAGVRSLPPQVDASIDSSSPSTLQDDGGIDAAGGGSEDSAAEAAPAPHDAGAIDSSACDPGNRVQRFPSDKCQAGFDDQCPLCAGHGYECATSGEAPRAIALTLLFAGGAGGIVNCSAIVTCVRDTTLDPGCGSFDAGVGYSCEPGADGGAGCTRIGSSDDPYAVCCP